MDVIKETKRLLALEDIENFSTPEDLAESILSEIEAKIDVSASDADQIGELCEEWFQANQ